MDGDPDAGYVGNTNIPKHLGGVVYVVSSSPITLQFSASFLPKNYPYLPNFLSGFVKIHGKLTFLKQIRRGVRYRHVGDHHHRRVCRSFVCLYSLYCLFSLCSSSVES